MLPLRSVAADKSGIAVDYMLFIGAHICSGRYATIRYVSAATSNEMYKKKKLLSAQVDEEKEE